MLISFLQDRGGLGVVVVGLVSIFMEHINKCKDQTNEVHF